MVRIYTFKEYLQKDAKNQKTVDGYVKDIKLFELYLDKEKIAISNVKETTIKMFVIWLKEQKYTNATIARKLSSLRKYFKFLRKEGILQVNPMEDIKQPKTKKNENKINQEVFETIKQVIDHEENKRDFLLFHLAYYERMKASELIQFKKEHYKKEQGIIYFEEKAIEVSQQTKRILDGFYEQVFGEYMFQNQHGKPLTSSGMYFVIKQYFKKAGKEHLRPVDLFKK